MVFDQVSIDLNCTWHCYSLSVSQHESIMKRYEHKKEHVT
jgi:hypothetical protein